MITKYLNKEISHKELIKSISTAIQVLEYYKVFGHTGIFDNLFENDDKCYMLIYPQIYFQKTYHQEYPIHVYHDSQYFKTFKSKFYTEPFKPESFHELMKFPNFMSNKIFVNADGNFTIKSNNFQYVAMFENKLFRPSEKTLETLGTK